MRSRDRNQRGLPPGPTPAGAIIQRALPRPPRTPPQQLQDEAPDERSYMARMLTLATMPHRATTCNEFVRRNGHYTLTMLAPSSVGLPYGTIPRLVLMWLTSEAVRIRSREIALGESLSAFMRRLNMIPTGGQWGSITQLRKQMRRLFACSITCEYNDPREGWSLDAVRVVDRAAQWWQPHVGGAPGWHSALVLGERFYDEVIDSPVPLSVDALRQLRRSPLALDIYCWLTHRLSYLRRPTLIDWSSLQTQFGAGYPCDARGLRDFRRAFGRELRRVRAIYQQARIEAAPPGLRLRPSPPHVARATPMRLTTTSVRPPSHCG